MTNFNLFAEVDMGSVMNNGMSLTEKITDSVKITLLGMGCIFGVIFTIWLMLTIFRFLINGLPKKSEKPKTPAKPKAPEKPSVTVSAVAVQPTATDDSVTVAVITAAISAYLASTSEDGTVLPFRVVSFKKKSGTPWNSR